MTRAHNALPARVCPFERASREPLLFSHRRHIRFSNVVVVVVFWIARARSGFIRDRGKRGRTYKSNPRKRFQRAISKYQRDVKGISSTRCYVRATRSIRFFKVGKFSRVVGNFLYNSSTPFSRLTRSSSSKRQSTKYRRQRMRR